MDALSFAEQSLTWGNWFSALTDQPGVLIAASACLLVGLVLLFAGARLVRVIFALVFLGLGLAIGRRLGQSLPGYWPIAAMVASSAVLSAVGWFMCRSWVTLTTGALLSVAAAIAAVVLLGLADAAVLSRLRPAVGAGEDRTTVRISSEQSAAAAEVRTRLTSNKWLLVLVAMAAVAGFVAGLLAGVHSQRGAAVLLTSVVGLALLLASAPVLAWKYWPAAASKTAAMGPKAWFGLVSLWLLGVAVQAALIFRRRPTPQGPSQQA